MKIFNSKLKEEFIVEWNNIIDMVLDESKRVYSLHDYNEESILFI